jgi:hypothetical protein
MDTTAAGMAEAMVSRGDGHAGKQAEVGVGASEDHGQHDGQYDRARGQFGGCSMAHGYSCFRAFIVVAVIRLPDRNP